MTTYSFSLQTGETGPLTKAPRPDTVCVPVSGMTPVLTPGDQVLAGTRIAKANNPDEGDVHAPISGIIKEVQPYSIRIQANGDDRREPAQPCADTGNALRSRLGNMGIPVRPLHRAQTLIINAVPPEPGLSIYEPLLRDYRKTLELGLETVKRIVEPTKMFLVAAKGNQANAFANCTVMHVAPVYPNGLDPLVIRAATGKEVLPGVLPKETTILSVKDLYFIGRVIETGRPQTETIMTINGQNQLVRIGTPVGFLAAQEGIIPLPGDRVVMGGPMRGQAAVNLEQGVGKTTTGLFILRQKESLRATDNFCLGCGECERHCPSRLMPGMISRCAEFKQFKRAENFHIHSCIECGLCGYWCTAQRPLLQYIRLAKYELALLAGARMAEAPEAAAQDGDTPC